MDGVSTLIAHLVIVTLVLQGIGCHGQNLALDQPVRQSSTSWNYGSELAVDGDPDTCSLTLRSSEQRWWHVSLQEDAQVQSVALTITPGTLQKFTIFVIDLDEKNRTSFVKCDSFDGTMAKREMLQCPGIGIRGHKVYIRDDRKEVNDLELCEVEVFGYYESEEEVPCLPLTIPDGQTSYANDKVTWQEQVNLGCVEGYLLWGSSQGKCLRNGKWKFDIEPSCQPITCGEPPVMPNAEVSLVRKPNVTGFAHIGDEAVYSCSNSLQLLNNGTYDGYTTEINAICTIDGTWKLEVSFSCLNETDIIADLMILGDNSLIVWEWLLYLLLLALILVMLVLLFCVLWRSHVNRQREKQAAIVTHPRILDTSYGSSTSFLLPATNAKPGILKTESQFDRQNVSDTSEDGQGQDRGPSIDTTSSILMERPYTGENFNEAMEDTISRPGDDQGRPQILMSTFKPSNTALEQLQTQQFQGLSHGPHLYWSPQLHQGVEPSNWDLRAWEAPHHLNNNIYPQEVALPSQFSPHYPPVDPNNMEPQQPFYSNLEEANNPLPQIDEAGYASLIIKPKVLPRALSRVAPSYQNTLVVNNPLLGYPDLLKNTEENPYVNEEAIASNAAEMYAKIDLSKKRNSQREEVELANEIQAQDQACQTIPKRNETELVTRFERFFENGKNSSIEDDLDVSHC